MGKSSASPFALTLVSMPWSLLNRPSIQIGALKAYLQQHENMEIDCYHHYLGVAKDMGTDEYHFISKNNWAGEALYSAILYPQRASRAKSVFQKSCQKNKKIADNFSLYCDILESRLVSWIAQTDWSKYTLLGMSVCFSQLFSSLAASRLIKERNPNILIVFGGSSCVGRMGESLLHHFPHIDYIIEGEGEKPLQTLCHFLQGKPVELPQQIHNRSVRQKVTCDHIDDINILPTPDYRSYFTEMAAEFPHQPFIPVLPLEFSRGCWWGKCTFCNLNLQWHGYRTKNATKMMNELFFLAGTHHCLDYTFCDNAMPVRESDIFFEKVRDEGKDFRFFAEFRAIKAPEKLSNYRQGGLTSVQVGVESLSGSLLEKMKKGTTVIENLAAMKHCLEHDISLEGNLIVEFPGSTEEDVIETLANLELALPFHPLSAATFFLGAGSAVAEDPCRFAIRTIVPHRNTLELFPEEIGEDIEMLIQDYRGDKSRQKKMWRPVRHKIDQWKSFHERRKTQRDTPLTYRDGGAFIIIRQERPDGNVLQHRLQGKSRELFLFCGKIHSLPEIKDAFPTLSEKSILNFFDDLSKKGLLYSEKFSYLSLAVHSKDLCSTIHPNG